jgi:serine/threonine-protein kinase
MPIGDFGDFELIEELGRGDLGIVHKARDPRDPSPDRLVALKLLQAGARASEDDLWRFVNEARVAAWLQQPQIVPNIVPIYSLGKHHDGFLTTMKLIGGPSLDRKLGEFAADPKTSARLVKTLAEAVHCAHQRETLHLDLKPSKVLIDESGEPHLTGFGLNKRVDADSFGLNKPVDTNYELILSGAIRGTPAYIAPEQAFGRRDSVTTATDVYGLGAILYALITGRAPFGADSPAETLARVRDGTPEPPSRCHPGISRDLEIIVLKCLEKDPERRYRSAEALADDLGRLLNPR